jgi:hypothetical protein
MSQDPLLLRNGLTGRVWIVTRYKVLDAERGRIEAITKYDVTDQFAALAQEREAADDEEDWGHPPYEGCPTHIAPAEDF